MSVKPEQTLEHNYLCLVLNVVEQLCQTTRSMSDIYSHSVKVEMLQSMAHLIDAAIALQVDDWEQQS